MKQHNECMYVQVTISSVNLYRILHKLQLCKKYNNKQPNLSTKSCSVVIAIGLTSLNDSHRQCSLDRIW